MKHSRFRTLLFTFTLGLAIAGIYARLSGYLEEIRIDTPRIESDTPIIIRVCPEPLTREEKDRLYKKYNGKYFSKSKDINCNSGGGAG